MKYVLALLAALLPAMAAHAIGFSYSSGASLYLRFKPGNVELALPATADPIYYEATTLTGVADGTYTVLVMEGTPGDDSETVVGMVQTPVVVASNAEVTSVPLTSTLAGYLATIYSKLPSGGKNIFGAGVTNTDGDDISGGSGSGQPRINRPPAERFTFDVRSREDGNHKARGKLRLTPNEVANGKIAFGVKMQELYGDVLVREVGTPTVSDGLDGLTVTALGPHSTIAMARTGGTVSGGETGTITLPVTMDVGEDGETIDVVLDVEILQP